MANCHPFLLLLRVNTYIVPIKKDGLELAVPGCGRSESN